MGTGPHWIFDGHIAGVGTASGLRAVVGIWKESPFGAFADVMVQQPSGHRLLLAPTAEVAGFISSTYSFDEVQVVEVSATLGEAQLTVDAGPLAVNAALAGGPSWAESCGRSPGPSPSTPGGCGQSARWQASLAQVPGLPALRETAGGSTTV
jgi:hypothetical protein